MRIILLGYSGLLGGHILSELAKHLNIDKEILNAPPTDGLWDDERTDEKQLGMSYNDLEEAMNNTLSSNRSKYENIRNANLHKIEPIPICKLPKK